MKTRTIQWFFPLLWSVLCWSACASSSPAADAGGDVDVDADAGGGDDAGMVGDDGGPAGDGDVVDAGGDDAGQQDADVDGDDDGGNDGGGDGGGDEGAPGEDGGDGDGADAGEDGADQGADEQPIVGLPYPERDAYHIKGIQPDFWPNPAEFVDHVTGGVSMNMVWDIWEPSFRQPPCRNGEEEYDGHCFRIDQNVDAAIRDYTARGVIVTGIVYGVPEWARTGNTGCSPISDAFWRFCTPDNPADYARFAGMIARRYDGLHGNGRIADFVIHNEVNSNVWFDIGCGQGVPCDQDVWIQTYVDNYDAAYDQIKSHQSEAKVLLSFEHHFDYEYDRPADDNAMLSVKTFVETFADSIGDREWKIAYHPYPPNLLEPDFGPLDLPRVTYGNLGVLLAWLRQRFPNHPHAWEVELTESGINSSSPSSSEAAQAEAVCRTFINVLGTPGVTNYIYHRMRDNADEGELQLGLVQADGSYKPSWPVWALCNHIYDNPPQLSCGFEDLPYTRLRRSVKDHTVTVRHWASSRLPPDGFVEEASWRLEREPQPGTRLLFECLVEQVWPGPHNFLSFDVDCEGRQNLGPVGYIYENQVPNSVALYRCISSTGFDHFVSTDPGCEGQQQEQLLGYAMP